MEINQEQSIVINKESFFSKVKKKAKNVFTQENRKKTFSILTAAILLVTLPTFVIAGLHQTQTQQHASTSDIFHYDFFLPDTYSNNDSTKFHVDFYIPTSFNQHSKIEAVITYYPDTNSSHVIMSPEAKLECHTEDSKNTNVEQWGETYLPLYGGLTTFITDYVFADYRGNPGDKSFYIQKGDKFNFLCTLWYAKNISGTFTEIPMWMANVSDPHQTLISRGLIAEDTFEVPGAPKSKTHSSCPVPGDAKTYFDGNLKKCYSSTGLGYNTQGGKYECGPVACPDQKISLAHGNTCIYSQVQKGKTVCFAGYGAGGFNPIQGKDKEADGCHYNPADNGDTIACPARVYKVTVNVHDTKGNGVKDIALTAYDNGRTSNITTDSSGNASFMSWSGDHFKIWTNANSSYTFDKDANHPIDGTINTSWSCGTQTGFPTPTKSNTPCSITASTTSSLGSSNSQGSQTQLPSQQNTSTNSTSQTTLQIIP